MKPMDSKSTEEELVVAALGADQSAFQEIVRRYHTMVYALALAKLRDREVAEDAAQEVFLRVYLHLGKLAEPRYLGTWVGRIARNLAEDWRRKNQRESEHLHTITDIGTIAHKEANMKSVPEKLQEGEFDDALNRAIRDLPTEQREIILLHFMQGWNYREIATKLERDPTTVSRSLKKSLETLREKIAVAMEPTAVTRPSPARAMALITAISALPLSAKASLASATESAILASGTSLKAPNLLASLVQSFKLLGTAKQAALVIAAAATVTGGAVVVQQSQILATPAATTTSQAAPSTPSPTPAKWDVNAPGLEGPWIAEMNGEQLVILITSQGGQLTAVAYNGKRARGSIAFQGVAQVGNEVHMGTPQSNLYYTGKRVAADKIKGQYGERGKMKDVDLQRIAVAPPSPFIPSYKEASIDPAKLDGLVGFFARNPTDAITVTREGNNLFMDNVWYHHERLYPESDTVFFSKTMDMKIEFTVDAKGIATVATRVQSQPPVREGFRRLSPDQQKQLFKPSQPRGPKP